MLSSFMHRKLPDNARKLRQKHIYYAAKRLLDGWSLG